MTQDSAPPVWKRNEPDSPCQNICLIDPQSGHCIGCNRTAAEISAWPSLSAANRQVILDELPNRQSQGAKRKGGRAKRLR